MSIKYKIANPITDAQWDDTANIYHDIYYSSNWAKVLFNTYNYNPHYLLLYDDDHLLATIPVMEVDSILTGKRGVSLPFTDCCEPVIHDVKISGLILTYLIEYARSAEWKYLELRGGSHFPDNASYFKFFYLHTLDLSQGEQEIFSRFRDSTKRNIRKAVSEGVEARTCTSWASVEEFYQLHCLTRRSHGLPPQPLSYFHNIYEYIIKQNKGMIITATHNNRIIASAMYFHWDGNAYYKFGASIRSCQYLRPNNLLMWEAIRWYINHGYTTLNLGRTDPQNKGLRQFKNGWGTEESIIRYYRFNLKDNVFTSKPDCKDISSVALLKLFPVPWLRTIGQMIYRHIG